MERIAVFIDIFLDYVTIKIQTKREANYER